jgi:hypothetical protein
LGSPFFCPLPQATAMSSSRPVRAASAGLIYWPAVAVAGVLSLALVAGLVAWVAAHPAEPSAPPATEESQRAGGEAAPKAGAEDQPGRKGTSARRAAGHRPGGREAEGQQKDRSGP